jgi:hypothetical protein
MAILYFDENLKRSMPYEYNLVISSISVIEIRKLERGIYEIRFKHPEFSDREPVIAKIIGNYKIKFQRKLDLRR